NLHNRVVLLTPAAFTLSWLTDGADDGISLAKAILLHLSERNVHVTGAGQVTARSNKGVIIEHIEDACDWQQNVIFGELWLVVVPAATLPLPLASTARASVSV